MPYYVLYILVLIIKDQNIFTFNYKFKKHFSLTLQIIKSSQVTSDGRSSFLTFGQNIVVL